MTIGDYLAAVAARGPRPEADRATDGPRLTYAELALDVERVACGLLAVGIEKGDRIVIWAHHSTEWTLVELAAARAGAVLVILDGEWSSGQLGVALRRRPPGCWPRTVPSDSRPLMRPAASCRRPGGSSRSTGCPARAATT